LTGSGLNFCITILTFIEMHKFPIFNFKRRSELPYDEFDEQQFAIYIVNPDWTYFFANSFACKSINKKKEDLVGESVYTGINVDPEYSLFLKSVEKGKIRSIMTVSPITGKRVSVTGYPLEDCYYFAVSVVPDKQSLMDELRNELSKTKLK
jgi:hypothetical protein